MVPIIQAKPEHLSAVYMLILQLAKYEGILHKIKITESQLGKLLFGSCPTHFVGTAIKDNQVCGLVMFNYTYNNICVNVSRGIYIENLYVSPECRRQGIGSALFNYVACQAIDNNCSRLEWWVSKENEAAGYFYQKMGAIPLDWKIFKADKISLNNLINAEKGR